MSRTLPEWIGATDDTPVPPHVKLRVFIRFNGRCPICTRPLRHKRWDCDHKVAIINDGQNRESNLQPVCEEPCHSAKTRKDVAEKSRTYSISSRHIGAKRKLRSITVWRKFNGALVRAPRQR